MYWNCMGQELGCRSWWEKVPPVFKGWILPIHVCTLYLTFSLISPPKHIIEGYIVTFRINQILSNLILLDSFSKIANFPQKVTRGSKIFKILMSSPSTQHNFHIFFVFALFLHHSINKPPIHLLFSSNFAYSLADPEIWILIYWDHFLFQKGEYSYYVIISKYII